MQKHGVNGYRPNGGPQVTWLNIIATLALLATVAGGAWILFQNQFANLQQEMRAADAALGIDIKDNRTELERLRNNTIARPEHQEFVKRVDNDLAAIVKRLDVIETTRPTTGEVQISAQGLGQRVDVIREALADLRKKVEATPTARNPVEARELDAEIGALSKRVDMIAERINALTTPQPRTIEGGSPKP